MGARFRTWTRSATSRADDLEPGRGSVYRLRDLARRDKLVAALLAAVLVLPTVIAFFQFIPTWRPAGDNAFHAVRAWDVGTSRTPAMGQPSTSGEYAGEALHVRHLGPWEFYLMAPLVRVLGSATGMLVSSALLSAFATLTSVWAVFRRLGATGGVLASAAMSAVLFGMGAGGMLNPITSSFASMPLLCSAVLVWAVICGDVRLLPLTTVMVLLTMQTHLSAGPTMAVLGLAAVVGLGLIWRRAGSPDEADRAPVLGSQLERRALGRLALVSLGLGLVIAVPLLIQEVGAGRGNLSALIAYTADGGGDTLGLGYSFRQLAHVVGYPPLLADTQLIGNKLLSEPALFPVISAVAVLAVIAAVGYRWLRTGDRRGGLAVIVGVLVLAGLVNGGNVPKGPEQGRITFYHWIWPLTFFILLALAYVIADAMRAVGQRVPWRPSWSWSTRHPYLSVRTTALAVGVVSMVGLAAVNPSLDRPTNTLKRMSATYERDVYDSLTDQVMEHEDLPTTESLMVLSRGTGLFEGSDPALSLSLDEAGQSVVYSRRYWTYVDDGHIAWERDEVDAVALLVVNRAGQEADSHPGTVVASYDLWDGFDAATYYALLGQFEGTEEVAPGPEFEQYAEERGPDHEAYFEKLLDGLRDSPGKALLNRGMLGILQEFPLASPGLDPDLLTAMEANLSEHPVAGNDALSMDVYLITDPVELDEVLRWRSAGNLR